MRGCHKAAIKVTELILQTPSCTLAPQNLVSIFLTSLSLISLFLSDSQSLSLLFSLGEATMAGKGFWESIVWLSKDTFQDRLLQDGVWG